MTKELMNELNITDKRNETKQKSSRRRSRRRNYLQIVPFSLKFKGAAPSVVQIGGTCPCTPVMERSVDSSTDGMMILMVFDLI